MPVSAIQGPPSGARAPWPKAGGQTPWASEGRRFKSAAQEGNAAMSRERLFTGRQDRFSGRRLNRIPVGPADPRIPIAAGPNAFPAGPFWAGSLAGSLGGVACNRLGCFGGGKGGTVALENRWPRATHAPGPGGLPGRESCTPTAQARSSTRFMRFMAFAEKVSFGGATLLLLQPPKFLGARRQKPACYARVQCLNHTQHPRIFAGQLHGSVKGE